MPVSQTHRVLKACRADLGEAGRADLDQCPATIGTTLKRSKLLFAAEALKHRRLLLLGDDDLLSVAIAATEPSIELAIVDLDGSLLSHIKQWTQHTSIEVFAHDLRLELPKELYHRFDVVFTDPPYTYAGQLLFLKRAITALRPVPGSSLYSCVSRLYLNDQQVANIVAAAKQGGLQLKNVYENFNKYSAPPDVREDLRKARIGGNRKFFYSALFHFVVGTHSTSAEAVPTPSHDIYKYE